MRDSKDDFNCPLCGCRLLWFPVSHIFVCESCEQSFNEKAEAYLRHPTKSPVGSAAAMREALERLDALNLNVLKYPLDGDSSEIYDADKKPIPLPMWGVATLLNGAKEAQVLARAALSAPARNCDVGTVEEQSARFVAWRYSNPLRAELGWDALEWAQKPYEQEVDEEHGKA